MSTPHYSTVPTSTSPSNNVARPPHDHDSKTASPYDAASLLAHTTFSYVYPLLQIGSKRSLLETDLPALPKHDEPGEVYSRLKSAWDSGDGDMVKAIWKAFRFEILLAGFWTFLEHVFLLLQPPVLLSLLSHLAYPPSTTPSYTSTGIQWALLLFACNLMQAIVHHQTYYTTMRLGFNLRISETLLIHNKTTRLTLSSASANSGLALNIISSDVMRFDAFCPALWHYLTGPIDGVIVTILLSRLVGWGPALAGIGIILADVFLKLKLGSAIGRVRGRTAKITDKRLRKIGEVIRGIETVKSYVWGDNKRNELDSIRAEEHGSIIRSQIMKGVNFAMVLAVPAVASLAMFGIYSQVDSTPLTTATILAAVSYLNVMRTAIGKEMSRATENGPECLVAVRRIENFMKLPEVQPASSEIPGSVKTLSGWVSRSPRPPHSPSETPSTPTVEIDHPKVTWHSPSPDSDSSTVLTTALSLPFKLSVTSPKLVMILGPTGCGKTSLLNTLLGEMNILNGEACTFGSVGYAPQQGFVEGGTVKENILMGSSAPISHSDYFSVLRDCCLDRDIEAFPARDSTMLGERGVNLSGGQRARLSLARALIGKPDILILDDPLSAVDPKVRTDLWRIIKGYEGIVVIATHQNAYREEADWVIEIDSAGEGKVMEGGCGGGSAEKQEEEIKGGMEGGKEEGEGEGITKKETKVSGFVSNSTYLAYLGSCGWHNVFFVLVLMCLGQACLVSTDYYLLKWLSSPSSSSRSISIYGLLVLLTVALSFMRSSLFFRSTLQASSKLHTNMLRSVLATSMAWFNGNPPGRILNRFSGDQANLDEQLSVVSYDTLQVAFLSLSAAVVVCVSVPWMIAIVPFLMYYLLRLRAFVTKSTRELKRFENVTRSPYFNTLNSTISNLPTLRAFGMGEERETRMLKEIEGNCKAWYWWLLSNRYIGFRLDMITVVLVLFVSVLGVLLKDAVDRTLVGMSLTYAISLSGNLQFMVRQSVLVETFMTSVERVIEYGDLEPEEEEGGGGLKERKGWITKGDLEVVDLEMKYGGENAPKILKGVSFSCHGGGKVGVCGRTGSGKSSFINAFMRLHETCGGKIMVDGVDLKDVRLSDLRREVTFVPQVPFLFEGPVCENIDPEGLHSLQDIRTALDVVGLQSLEVDDEVENNGGNLSVGQCQLLSLARAGLRRSKIVLLDEPTANTDHRTDETLKSMLTFKTGGVGDLSDSTVVVVAHRVQGIKDFDRVVVLGAGEIEEQGIGTELASKKGGVFCGMLKI